MFWPRGGNVEGNYFAQIYYNLTGYSTFKLTNRAERI